MALPNLTQGIFLHSAVPLRAESSHRSELVSQGLFGETWVQLERKNEDWLLIKTGFDNYQGWLDSKLACFFDDLFMAHYLTTPESVFSSFSGKLLSQKEGCVSLSFGSSIRLLHGSELRTGHRLTTRTKIFPFPQKKEEKLAALLQRAKLWPGVPYLWGGRSIFGVDCSGFVQLLFKSVGIALPRDSSIQQKIGNSVSRDLAQPGDLAFFHNPEGKIIHVGLVINKDSIIHASGEVRIDHFLEDGILHTGTGKQTHQLHSIKRVLE